MTMNEETGRRYGNQNETTKTKKKKEKRKKKEKMERQNSEVARFERAPPKKEKKLDIRNLPSPPRCPATTELEAAAQLFFPFK